MEETRTALYTRYSSPNTASRGGVSTADQLKRLRAAAQEAGERIVAELEDQARTGTEMSRREAYQELLRLAEAGAIDRVRIETVDRANRNELDRRLMERDLARHNVDIVYLGERADLSEYDRNLQRGIKGVLAEDESIRTSHRVYRRTRFRAEQGRWRGGRYPYGLKPDGRGWFDPDPATYPVLIWILERRAEKWGASRTAGALNAGISLDGEAPWRPATSGRLEYGRKPFIERINKETGDIDYIEKTEPLDLWNASTIHRIWTEAEEGVYAGVFNWGNSAKRPRDDLGRLKTPIRYEQHAALVPADLLRRVQAVQRAAHGTRRGGRVSWTFIIKPVCGACGSPCLGVSSHVERNNKVYDYRKYYCGRSKEAGQTHRCGVYGVTTSEVEAEVLRIVYAAYGADDPSAFQRRLREARSRVLAEYVEGIADLDRRILEIQQIEADTISTLTNLKGAISPELHRAILKRAEDAVKERAALEAERREVELGLRMLHEQAAVLGDDLLAPLLRPEHWQEESVRKGLKRTLEVLVEAVILHPTDTLPGKYGKRPARIEVRLRKLEDLVGG